MVLSDTPFFIEVFSASHCNQRWIHAASTGGSTAL